MNILRFLLPSALLALLLAGELASQSSCCPPPYYMPRRLVTTEGRQRGEPFQTISRTQWLYHGSISKVLGGSRMAFRGDGNLTHGGVANVEIEIMAGGSPMDPFAMSPSFPDNRGTDFATVFDRKTISLPPLTGQLSPQPFDVTILFDRPLPVRVNPNFLVELIVWDSEFAATSYSVDVSGFDPSTYVHTGVPCNGLLQLAVGEIRAAQSQLQLSGLGTSTFASGPSLLLVGTGPLPAPVPLGLPGGCSLYQDIVAAVAGTLDPTGRADVTLPLPVGAKGLSLQTQFLAATPGLNQFAASQSITTTIGGLEAIGTVFTDTFASQFGTIIISEVGRVSVGGGPVLRID